MPDTAFQLVFWLIFGTVAVIALLCVIGAVFHLAAFGAIFGIVAKRIRAAHAEEAAARVGRRCGHCGSTVSAGARECPNCAAPIGRGDASPLERPAEHG